MEHNILYCKIFLDKRENGIVQNNGSVNNQNESDFYINIPLTRTYKKFDDYVNVDKDPFRTIINRQQINPYFIELNFFETIKQISGTTEPYESIESKAETFKITINK